MNDDQNIAFDEVYRSLKQAQPLIRFTEDIKINSRQHRNFNDFDIDVSDHDSAAEDDLSETGNEHPFSGMIDLFELQDDLDSNDEDDKISLQMKTNMLILRMMSS